MTSYQLSDEASVVTQQQLLEAVWNSATEFSLTVREECISSRSVMATLEELSPFQLMKTRTNEWPGTILESSFALVFRYRCSPETIALLHAFGRGILEWNHPESPEDLALYRANGSVLVESISHERDALLWLTEDEYRSLPRDLKQVLWAVDLESMLQDGDVS